MELVYSHFFHIYLQEDKRVYIGGLAIAIRLLANEGGIYNLSFPEHSYIMNYPTIILRDL